MKSDQQSSTIAGAINSHCHVTSEGHALCTIPISVPPGTAKIEPNLSLVYASDHENGPLGLGWRLGGLSTITRVGQTMAQDGNWTTVDYSDNDRFALDGQRLVPLISRIPLEDVEFHTERETWLRIIAIKRPGIEGPAGFRVTTKKGTVIEYGLDPDGTSRVMAVGRNIARSWGLSRVQDLFGNYMTVTYSQDMVNGSHVPSTIAYTGNVEANVLPRRSVVFEYEPRTDEIVRYQGGAVIGQTQRLKTIKTFIDQKPVYRYAIDYQYGARSGYSQISNLTLSDGSGEQSLPVTTMGWASEDEALFLPCRHFRRLQLCRQRMASGLRWMSAGMALAIWFVSGAKVTVCCAMQFSSPTVTGSAVFL